MYSNMAQALHSATCIHSLHYHEGRNLLHGKRLDWESYNTSALTLALIKQDMCWEMKSQVYQMLSSRVENGMGRRDQCGYDKTLYHMWIYIRMLKNKQTPLQILNGWYRTHEDFGTRSRYLRQW